MMKQGSLFDNTFILIQGIPDRGNHPVRLINKNQTLSVDIAGTANFINHIPELAASAHCLWLPISKSCSIDVPKYPIVNHMADPDFYDLPLCQAIELAKILDTPCFNHPAAVKNNSRERLKLLLQDISGLIVPKCIRIKPKRPHDFHTAIADQEFSYPVIVRLCGTHGGQTQVLINNKNDWDNVYSIPWINSDVYITEFYNYCDLDGYFRKQRVTVIGDIIFPRHCCAKKTWSVSGHDSPPETMQHELEWNETFYRKSYPIIKDRICQISQALDLDYYGIDYSLRPDGIMLIFEASACMSLLDSYGEVSHHMIEDFPENAKKALKNLLSDPCQWRHSQRIKI
jgi:hypothetical protein